MPKWEYTELHYKEGGQFGLNTYITIEQLNKLGQEGWELLPSMTESNDYNKIMYVFFRRKIENPAELTDRFEDLEV